MLSVRPQPCDSLSFTRDSRLFSTDPAFLRRSAKVAGALYLAMMPFGFFGIVYVPSILLVPGDSAATFHKVMASEGLLRAGTVSHFVGQILFIFLALALFRLLQAVNHPHAVLMAVFAIVGVPLTLYNEVHHLAVLSLLDPRQSAAWSAEQLSSLVMLLMTARSDGIILSQVFWGLWLLPLGYLVLRASFLPSFLGVLLIVAGLGYLSDVGIQLLLPSVTFRLSQFTFVGELLFPLWLLIRGVKPVPPVAAAS